MLSRHELSTHLFIHQHQGQLHSRRQKAGRLKEVQIKGGSGQQADEWITRNGRARGVLLEQRHLSRSWKNYLFFFFFKSKWWIDMCAMLNHLAMSDSL